MIKEIWFGAIVVVAFQLEFSFCLATDDLEYEMKAVKRVFFTFAKKSHAFLDYSTKHN